MSKKEFLDAVATEIIVCTKCPLWKTRKNAVPGEGNSESPVMFIGEAPGQSEDIKGKPFVGAAGKFLETMLSEIGLSRNDVFICNIVKCRPPRNREPMPNEIQTCTDPVRKAITFLGREALLECKRECERAGYKVEYGDTDGLFVHLFGTQPNEGRVVEDIVNRTLRKIAWRHGAYYSLEAKYETFCRRIIFVPKIERRHGIIIAAKKRYGYTDEKGNLYVIGLAPRRSSTPIVVRRNMLDWLFKVLRDNDVEGAIKLVRTLYETLPTFPLNMIGLPKGLHKAEYHSRNPWKIGVDFMRQRYGKVFREDKKPLLIYMRVPPPKKRIHEGNSVFDKNTLSYAVCITETDTTLPQELQSRIDWVKMRDKVITRNFKPLFQAIGIPWDIVIKKSKQEGMARWLA